MNCKKLIIPILFGSIITTSCNKEDSFICKKGNGDITIEKHTLTSFSEVDFEIAGNVFIKEGNESTVEIHASSNIHEHIILDVEDDQLEIESKLGKCLNDDVKIYITSPSYTKLELSGSGTITNTDSISSNNLEVEVEGSGNIELDKLSITSYTAEVSGSGKIVLKGNDALIGKIEISGSGEVNTQQLTTTNQEIEISGSGDAKVQVTNLLSVEITGSGEVNYSGSPQVKQEITGSGSVNPI